MFHRLRPCSMFSRTQQNLDILSWISVHRVTPTWLSLYVFSFVLLTVSLITHFKYFWDIFAFLDTEWLKSCWGGLPDMFLAFECQTDWLNEQC